jgi:hypothetical protein
MSENKYDSRDIVRREAVVIADGVVSQLKVAAYRIRDPETQEWSSLQFHMTYDNTVMCVMGEEAAKFFCGFVQRTIEAKPPDAVLKEEKTP